jgi:hypothetical protein
MRMVVSHVAHASARLGGRTDEADLAGLLLG